MCATCHVLSLTNSLPVSPHCPVQKGTQSTREDIHKILITNDNTGVEGGRAGPAALLNTELLIIPMIDLRRGAERRLKPNERKRSE